MTNTVNGVAIHKKSPQEQGSLVCLCERKGEHAVRVTFKLILSKKKKGLNDVKEMYVQC